MKKLTLLMLLITCITFETKAQQENNITDAPGSVISKSVAVETDYSFSKNLAAATANDPAKDYDFYMRKSKRSRNTGLILLGSGVLLSGIGAILSFGNGQGYFYNETKGDAGAVLLITGAAAGIASIPFMAVALGRKNKAKAMLSSQKTGFGVPSNVSNDIVGLTLQIPISK